MDSKKDLNGRLSTDPLKDLSFFYKVIMTGSPQKRKQYGQNLVITNTLSATTALVHLLVVSNVITPDSEEPTRRPSQLLILFTVSYYYRENS